MSSFSVSFLLLYISLFASALYSPIIRILVKLNQFTLNRRSLCIFRIVTLESIKFLDFIYICVCQSPPGVFGVLPHILPLSTRQHLECTYNLAASTVTTTNLSKLRLHIQLHATCFEYHGNICQYLYHPHWNSKRGCLIAFTKELNVSLDSVFLPCSLLHFLVPSPFCSFTLLI